MKVVTRVVRTPEDRQRASYLEPDEDRRGRPPRLNSIVIRTLEDAEAARNDGLPIFPLTSGIVTSFSYPMHFPARVVVTDVLSPAVRANLDPIVFHRESAVRDPRLVDIALAMLSVDTIAARAILDRNRDLVDPAYLLKRVLQEDLEEPATMLRFQEIAPGLPVVGTPLPRAALQRQLGKNLPRTVL